MREPLTFGSLFTGIGGLDLGLERAGMRCEWQVEIDDYATRVLARHWPDVPRYRDVRGIGAHNLSAVDVICGGFPCQDISDAGRRAGINGARSGLWHEFARIVGELRPRYVLVENVAALLYRGMGTVLADLSTLGYDAEWSIVSACAMGAPHPRERLFIVAYAQGIRGQWGGSVRVGSGATTHQIGVRDRWKARFGTALPVAFVEWLMGFPAGWSLVVKASKKDRLRGLGNAVVPQVAEAIGHLIEQHRIMEER